MSKNGEIVLKTKSRTGCQECKAKRLKCDESRPGCKQCARRRRPCPGYRREFRWSTKYEKTLPECVAPDLPIDDLETLTSLLLPSTHQAKANGEISVAPTASPNSSLSQTDRAVESQAVPNASPADLQRVTLDQTSQQDHADILDDADLFGTDSFAFSLHDGTLLDSSIDVDLEHFGDESTTELGDRADSIGVNAIDDPLQSHASLSTSLALQTYRGYLPLPRALNDMSTVLIRYWFTDVCTMWSAFDSEINPNRQLAYSTWSTSEPVNTALQYMAATCLADTLPHVKPHVLDLANQALESIGKWKTSAKPADESKALPADLLLAMFAVGTTLCWTDTKQLGLQLLTDARQILGEHAVHARNMDRDGRRYLAHFQAALVYWEMLAKAIGDAVPSIPSGQKRSGKAPSASSRPYSGGLLPQPSDGNDSTPHPWTGISTNIHEVFGTVLELCRRSRLRTLSRSGKTMNANALREALDDIEQSQGLATELNDLVFVADLTTSERGHGSPVHETGDEKTPIQHFVDIAEAYRLAALVQLYLTFPEDIEPPQQCLDHEEGEAEVAVTLALELVDVLNRIPVTSGTRCIQPLLFISAAAGLKYSSLFDSSIGSDPGGFPQSMPQLTNRHLNVAQARKSVLNRLSVLQGSLPRRPIVVAMKLAKAVWEDYDCGIAGIGEHWMDTMTRTGHWTLFG